MKGLLIVLVLIFSNRASEIVIHDSKANDKQMVQDRHVEFNKTDIVINVPEKQEDSPKRARCICDSDAKLKAAIVGLVATSITTIVTLIVSFTSTCHNNG